MTQLLFAANWKMHLGPLDTRAYFQTFLPSCPPRADRSVWFFPPAVSLSVAADCLRDRTDLLVGAQDIHWEPKGAFTGAISAPLALQAGAGATLIGHSERRHVFGESDAETGRKVRAALEAGLTPVLCVGEKLEEREAAQTERVVTRQLEAGLDGIGEGLTRVVIAYEPVWAIGTGRSATPGDAAAVHAHIRAWLTERGHGAPRVLYGGSVKADNAESLLAEPELDGVLVGGASLNPTGWAAIAQTEVSRLAS